MPRFEMYLLIAELSDDNEIITREYEMICYVKSTEDTKSIEASANKVIQSHVSDAEHTVAFGTALISIKGEEIMNIGFRNTELEYEDVNNVIDLFMSDEGTVH